MLVLSRERDESVVFVVRGVTFRVCVVELGNTPNGNRRVRLGIDAPAEVIAIRDELLERPDYVTQTVTTEAQPPAPQSTEGVS